MTLIANKAYSFKVLSKSATPDGEAFYVLEDIYKHRHLLPAKYYAEYKLQIGTTITCYIDKINCAGKIFLEPVHPYYKLGQNFDFKYVGAAKRKIKREIKDVLLLCDVYGNEQYVEPNNRKNMEKFVDKTIFCNLKRIKKGKFHLIIINDE